MGDSFHHLMKYLIIALVIFLVSCLLVIGSTIYAFVTQPNYYSTDGTSLLKHRNNFFIAAIVGNIAMFIIVLVMLCLFRFKKTRNAYAIIFAIGFVFFGAVFLSSFPAFHEPQKIEKMSAEEKKYNENLSNCCFESSSLSECGCSLSNKALCPVCEDEINDIPFFIAFLSNAIGSCTLFSGIYLSCFYYYKKIEEAAEQRNISKLLYLKQYLVCSKTYQTAEEKTLIN